MRQPLRSVEPDLQHPHRPEQAESSAAFTGLGRMHVDDPRFQEPYDRVAPGLAELVRDAMAEYARVRLA